MVVEGASHMYLWPVHTDQPLAMSSKLLLRWAPKMQQVCLSSGCARFSGIQMFLAATCLDEATISFPAGCQDVRWDVIVYCHKQNCQLAYEGSRIGANQVGSQAGHRKPQSAQSRSELLRSQLDDVLGSMCSMPLQKLTMSMELHREIRSRVLLPNLPALHVSISRVVGWGDVLDLSWLQHQQHDQLHLDVSLVGVRGSSYIEDHRQTTHELEQLRISTLVLRVPYSLFPPTAQHLWAQLTVHNRLYLHYAMNDGGALDALPTCQHIAIKVYSNHRMGQEPVLQVSWSAIGMRAGRVHMSLPENLKFGVLGFTSLVTSGPWQLVVHSGRCSGGLPSSRPCCGSYFLQNHAADGDGWAAMPLHSCRCLGP